VEKIINVPLEFQAVNIQEGISVLMMEKARELERTKERMQSLINEYSAAKGVLPEKEHRFLLIPPKKMVKETREQMLKNAKENIRLITTSRRFSQGLAQYLENYEEILRRNVYAKVIVIIGDEAQNSDFKKLKNLEQYPNFSLRLISEAKSNMLIIDNTEASVTLQPKADLGTSPVIWTDHPEFLAIYREYFEHTWEKAQQPPGLKNS
jgi:sugar-specific transcriptional regulator TrmB